MNKELQDAVNALDTAISEIAATEGVSVVVVEDSQLSTVASANNNSICRMLSTSDDFGESCKKFCGQVYDRALKSPKPLKYRCHAGLDCIAVPVQIEGKKPLVAISGRTFTKADEYRQATERAITGDWRHFPPTSFFENVLLSSDSTALEKAARRVLNLIGKLPESAAKVKDSESTGGKPKIRENRQVAVKSWKRRKEIAEASEWRSRLSAILNGGYREACVEILEFVEDRYGIGSSAWLEVKRNSFEKVLAKGELQDQKIQISVAADDKALQRLFEREYSVELRERGTKRSKESESMRLFPITGGGTIRSALVIGEQANNQEVVTALARLCASLAPELEILRLRSELSRREGLEYAMFKFSESLKVVDTEEFWSDIMRTTAELLQAERGSLLVYDEERQSLVVKAALGPGANEIEGFAGKIGERISSKVWRTGKPAIVQDISKLSMAEAPEHWNYRSKSFISYPLLVGTNKIGVINLTDKAGGGSFEDFDVDLLDSVVPQIAIAVDRALLQSKAGEFEKLSVTDSLTGLLNRRYLEQRLAEEIKRSSRHGYPMCFIMIDVDDFKSYNDAFLHPEGDKALKIVGNCLKDTLRGADVAVRYGGEEFSVLLPQTTIEEGETIAERIRHRIESTRFPHRQVTVSVGIASLTLEINSTEKLIEAADAALFEAKRKGKNVVHTFGGRVNEMRTGR
ncbi:MAG: diguanylate cyclase [Acidobacteria bacterium]|nr:MAG: diguanylate cyclase [Acidobacteriota bacterium]REK02383.1 MAG: diguanylate cyclase [Acidobacteriota bacterium]REK13816.1 MAG: diguanylate cyclase [Acidobacteriota bacterium]REK41810.1 MAG: diguanylate cyclase [Acidobacteriota bacterium]